MRRRRLKHPLCVAAAVLLGLLLVQSVLVEPFLVVPRRLEVPCEGLESGPVRILLLSDVDFHGMGVRERRVQEVARDFAPDLVLLAGDVLNDADALHDPQTLAEAARFIESLPARSGRFLVPGEDEAVHLDALRAAWPEEVVEVLSNEARLLTVGGEQLDLFGSDPSTDPPPWTLGRDEGRPHVQSRGRWARQSLALSGPEPFRWDGLEVGFSFQALHRRSYLEVRLAWQDAGEEGDGGGWRLVRNGKGRPFRLHARHGPKRALAGRTDSGFEPRPGHWYRARVRVDVVEDGSRIRARFWPEDGPEPDGWAIDAIDRLDAGRARFGRLVFGGREGGRRYAALRVRSAEGAELLSEDFDDPELFDERWDGATALGRWLRLPDRPRPRLLLTHSPDRVLDLLEIDAAPPCLTLAGHTHGGQVRLPFWGPLVPKTALGRGHAAGLSAVEGCRLYVTVGLGTSILPVRFLNPPEVTLLELVPTG